METRHCAHCGRGFLTRRDKHQQHCNTWCYARAISKADSSQKSRTRLILMKSDLVELNRLCEHLHCFRGGLVRGNQKPSISHLMRGIARGEFVVTRRSKS